MQGPYLSAEISNEHSGSPCGAQALRASGLARKACAVRDAAAGLRRSAPVAPQARERCRVQSGCGGQNPGLFVSPTALGQRRGRALPRGVDRESKPLDFESGQSRLPRAHANRLEEFTTCADGRLDFYCSVAARSHGRIKGSPGSRGIAC